MNEHPARFQGKSRGFSNPHNRRLTATSDGRKSVDRRINACGFPPDREDEDYRRAEQDELRQALTRLIGSEHEFDLLLRVVEQELSIRSLATETGRDVSVLCRRLPRYLAYLKAAAAADTELRDLFSRFLPGSFEK